MSPNERNTCNLCFAFLKIKSSAQARKSNYNLCGSKQDQQLSYWTDEKEGHHCSVFPMKNIYYQMLSRSVQANKN